MHALAWKLLSDMGMQGISTNELEMQELRRSWQRNCKRGYRGTLKQFGESEVYVRDEKNIRGLLQLREEQAREDWSQMRRVYRERKICLVEGAKAQ